MYELLRMKNSGLRKDVMAFTQELIDTPSPSMGEKDVADKVTKQMEILGYHHVYRDEVGNVIGVVHGHEQKSTLLLNSHLSPGIRRTGSRSANSETDASCRSSATYPDRDRT